MSDLNLLSDAQPTDDFATIADVPIQAGSSRITPQNIASGLNRGDKLNTGVDGYPQVLQGNQKTFGNGFYVAKPANDVTQVTNAANFIFNSNQNAFKIAAIVTGSYTVTATDASNAYANFSFDHSLGIAPTVDGSFITTVDSAKRQLPYTYRSSTQSYYTISAPGGTDHIASAAVDIYSIDTTSINISIKIFDILGLSWLLGGAVFTFQFYCRQETIVSS